MDERVDVVIPVYNAPEFVRRCIESLRAHLAHRVAEVHVQDDASDAPTRELLDSMSTSWDRLRVHHAERNVGFGENVNRGVARTRTPFVLVLNSDVEASEDFVAPLLRAVEEDPRLASVSPAGNALDGYDLARYARRHGCVVSNSIWGYAFLLRRAAWDEVGGFDRAFGRGFYEDLDLSRRLLAKGWWLAVHPDARLWHASHGSFRELSDFRELLGANRERYLARFPEARRQVLLATGDVGRAGVPADLGREIEGVLGAGGALQWLHTGSPPELPCLPARSARLDLFSAVQWIGRRARKGRRQFTDLWLLEGAPRLRARLLERAARRAGVAVRRFDDERRADL